MRLNPLAFIDDRIEAIEKTVVLLVPFLFSRKLSEEQRATRKRMVRHPFRLFRDIYRQMLWEEVRGYEYDYDDDE